MATRDHRAFRFCLALLLVVVISSLSLVSAQSTALTQVGQTLDGDISIRLPEGWMARDAAASTLTSVLAFGDTAESLQVVIDSLRGVEATAAVRMNGVIGIIDPQLLVSLPTDLAMSTMLNAMISGIQTAGGQIVEQQSIMLGEQYPASVAVVTTGDEAKGIIGVFQAGADIVQFTMGASPERNFDANRQMFIDMMNSIRVPGEGDTAMVPTAAIAEPIPVQQAEDSGEVASPSGIFSVSLPEGWAQQAFALTGFTDMLAFGTTQTNVEGIITAFTSGAGMEGFDGIAGFIGVVDTSDVAGQALNTLVSPLMQQILTSIENDAVETIEAPATHTFGEQFEGQLALLNVGYIAVFHTDEQLLVGIVMSNDVETNRATMLGILESIQIPAASGEPQITLPGESDSPAALHILRSSDGQVSLEIPENWTVLDHVADNNVLAYGEDDDAAQSRLHSANAELAPDLPMSGTGGLIILYPMSQFDIDPQQPELAPLMERALGGLEGYTVEQAAQELDGGGLYAVISGTERGYLALLPFGDQIAYVTATGTQETFPANQASLLAVVHSVRVPAASEDSSLGGLGGLEAEATEAPAGLGGL